MYIISVIKILQYVEILGQCQVFNWPPEPVSIPTDKPYEESPLLKVLFNKISHLLDQVGTIVIAYLPLT